MALNLVSTTFYKGDQVALVGNNGAGKSSLLKTYKWYREAIRRDNGAFGQPIKKYTPEIMSNHVAFVFQNAEEMFIDDSVRKEIEFYLKARNVEDLSLVDQVIRGFRFNSFAASGCSFVKWWAAASSLIGDWCSHETFHHYSG